MANLRTPTDMIGWLRAGAEGRKAATAAIAYALKHPGQAGVDGERLIYQRNEVRLLAPLPRPLSFRDFSIYEEHMTKAQFMPLVGGKPWVRDPLWYTNPPYYKGSCAGIRGPEDPVPWPYYTELLDLELEIGIIVGKQGRNLTFEQAAEHIGGYTILIDSSARDGFKREPFGPTKRKDFHTALGPCLVTPDEIDFANLKCRIEVDGELWFEGTTGAPHAFTPAQLVAYSSDNEDLYPGDLIGTGTVGFGCSQDLHKWIKIGQTATFTVEKIGSMHLKVVKGDEVVKHVNGMKGLLPIPKAPA
ncbi:MAG: fumarylacetoacetate hydrolase family protein [Alphaproteobacteria bacterium]